MFGGHYHEWRARRIRKIIKIIGRERLTRLEVLELGCGHGDIGIALWQAGAKVTFSDARQEHLDEIKQRYPGIAKKKRLIQIDQENCWSLDRRFDLIVHFGLLYHVRNWPLSLDCSLAHADAMLLEKYPTATIPIMWQWYGKEGMTKPSAAKEVDRRRLPLRPT